eukprot:156367_1
MEQLAALNAYSLEKYLHGVVDGYIGRSTSHISEDDTLKQLPNPSKSRLSLELIDIFETSCQNNDMKQLQHKFNQAPKQLLECIINVTTIRMQEIFTESKKRSILAGLPHSLQDFDWSLRLIMSSSTIQSVRIPVVLLTLTLSSGTNTHNVTLELNKRELNQLIESLSSVQKVVKTLERGMKQKQKQIHT